MYCIPVGDLKYCTSTTYTCRGSEVLGRTSRRCQSSGPWPARRGRPVALFKVAKNKITYTKPSPKTLFPKFCSQNFVPKTLFPKTVLTKTLLQNCVGKTFFPKLASQKLACGEVMTNCSTFSNWWTRKMPRVSLPWEPTSCLGSIHASLTKVTLKKIT